MGRVRTRIMYVELKTGHHDDGPAWIGRVGLYKTGRTVYYRGLVLRRHNGVAGNHTDVDTGHEYWISGPRRDRRDRRHGNAPVHVDPEAQTEYHALLAAPLTTPG